MAIAVGSVHAIRARMGDIDRVPNAQAGIRRNSQIVGEQYGQGGRPPPKGDPRGAMTPKGRALG